MEAAVRRTEACQITRTKKFTWGFPYCKLRVGSIMTLKAYLSSPNGKRNSAPIKLSGGNAVDGIDEESSPCPYHKRIDRYWSSFFEHITKKQLC